MSLLTLMARRSLGGSSFAPTDIAGLQLWLKADSLALNDADPVGTWTDQSGNGRDASQATAAKKPLYKTNIVNGKPVVRFDGIDDVMSATIASGTSALLFVVMKGAAGHAANARAISFNVADTGSIILPGTETYSYYPNAAFAISPLEAGTSIAAAFSVVLVAFDSNAVARGYVNSSTATAADFDPNDIFSTATSLQMGGQDATPTNPAAMDLAEVGLYAPAPSAGNRGSLLTYLGTKYNITIA